MVNCQLSKTNVYFEDRLIGRWFDELQLYVAPACNMLCNFCSKGNDCICNGNDPGYCSRVMMPRQAVNYAVSSSLKDKRVKVIKISGPGEPLYNSQTFEVLKRIGQKLNNVIFSISTNGLLLEEKIEDLKKYGVGIVDLSINAVNSDIIKRFYSKIILNGNIIAGSSGLANTLIQRQLGGLKKCLENGISVKVNTIYFPGINDHDIFEITEMCKDYGVESMCLISGYPGGKMTGVRVPSIEDLVAMQQKLIRIIPDIRIKTFVT